MMLKILLFVTMLFQSVLPLQDSSLEDRARQLIDQMNAGQFESATQYFDEAMLQALPADRLSAVWQETLERYGALQSTGTAQVEPANGYTAVIVQAQFERAVVNVRVVFDAQERIAGLFFLPTEVTAQTSPLTVAAFIISGIFVILLPIFLAIAARRRLQVAWKFLFFGAAIFLVFQLLTRIPLISIISAMYGGVINASRLFSIAWIVILSFSAGIFEEFGRWIGYRWLFQPKERTWRSAVMYGLGHGGFEAIVLVGISQLSAAALLLAAPAITGSLPSDQAPALLMQIAAISGSPAWLPFLGAFERVASIALHVALSVMVLQVFRRRQPRWIWLAVGLHGLANTVIAGFPTIFQMPTGAARIFSTVMLAVTGLVALWIIRRLRDGEAPVEPQTEAA